MRRSLLRHCASPLLLPLCFFLSARLASSLPPSDTLSTLRPVRPSLALPAMTVWLRSPSARPSASPPSPCRPILTSSSPTVLAFSPISSPPPLLPSPSAPSSSSSPSSSCRSSPGCSAKQTYVVGLCSAFIIHHHGDVRGGGQAATIPVDLCEACRILRYLGGVGCPRMPTPVEHLPADNRFNTGMQAAVVRRWAWRVCERLRDWLAAEVRHAPANQSVLHLQSQRHLWRAGVRAPSLHRCW